jgi:1-aminocyclopropane-1-carboxylate deaminase/D-cysteine desulfhydrase-like pyridoxal-dependent ACC family enzyme
MCPRNKWWKHNDSVLNMSQSFMVQIATVVNYTSWPTVIDICRQISRTAAAQAIKYEISSTKIVATKLIDKSSLQETREQSKTLESFHLQHQVDTMIRMGNPHRDPRLTQEAQAWSRSHTILDRWVVAVTTAGTMATSPLEEKLVTKLTIIKYFNLFKSSEFHVWLPIHPHSRQLSMIQNWTHLS